MRRICTTAIALILGISFLVSGATASSVEKQRIDYEDGSYTIITTVVNGMTRASTNDSKTYTY